MYIILDYNKKMTLHDDIKTLDELIKTQKSREYVAECKGLKETGTWTIWKYGPRTKKERKKKRKMNNKKNKNAGLDFDFYLRVKHLCALLDFLDLK